MQVHLRHFIAVAGISLSGCASAPMAHALTKLPDASPADPDAETYVLDGMNAHLETDVTALATYTLHYGKLHGTLVINPKTLSVRSLDVEVDTHEVHAKIELAATLGRTKFLECDQFPTARFSGQSEAAPSAAAATATFAGELKLHGITKLVEVPAVVKSDTCELSFSTAFTINRHDYNVQTTGELENAVGDNVEIRVDAKVPRQHRPSSCNQVPPS